MPSEEFGGVCSRREEDELGEVEGQSCCAAWLTVRAGMVVVGGMAGVGLIGTGIAGRVCVGGWQMAFMGMLKGPYSPGEMGMPLTGSITPTWGHTELTMVLICWLATG